MTPDRKYCDEIIVVRTKQEEIADDVKDLKNLYEPVQKLKTIFYILSVFVVLMIGLSGFLWRDLYEMRKDLYEYNRDIMQEFYNINIGIEKTNLKNTERELDYLKRLTEKENEKNKRSNR